jgi:hypothetical protein
MDLDGNRYIDMSIAGIGVMSLDMRMRMLTLR